MFSRAAWLLTGLLGVATLIGAFLSLMPRWKAEASHTNLAIILDYQQLFTLAQDEGYDIDVWLGQLREAGFDHLAMMEDTPSGWSSVASVRSSRDFW